MTTRRQFIAGAAATAAAIAAPSPLPVTKHEDRRSTFFIGTEDAYIRADESGITIKGRIDSPAHNR